MNLFRYLKTAFLNRWNLLAFGGGLGFAILSGRPDVFAPLVLAGELLFLGLLGTHPRFQRAVDAHEHASTSQMQSTSAEDALQRIIATLPARALERFEALRTRCLELRQIALQMKDPVQAAGPPPLDALQQDGLDRLLWMHLRLLFNRHALDRFLATTPSEAIEAEIRKLEARMSEIPQGGQDPQGSKIRRALEDNLETCRTRLSNHAKARDSLELVELEISRLENKIHSLGELAVNRQEPDFISNQVDQVAASMLNTERTMSELEFATGLATREGAVPQLLQRRRIVVRE